MTVMSLNEKPYVTENVFVSATKNQYASLRTAF